LDIALTKIDSYLSSIRKISDPGKILVHCWRGGLRSATMAEVFDKAGYEVGILKGGYKAYRQFIRTQLAAPRSVIVLGGYTGSGKTEILRSMSSLGAHVIDLEGLAHHKGSVFGSLGELPQPTNEQFENDLYDQWKKLPPDEPVWLEDESRMIGRVTLPEPVYLKILQSPMVKIDVEKNIRIQNLVNGYAGFEKSLLAEAINRISRCVGGDKAKSALSALDECDFHAVAGIVLSYYDKAYRFAVERRPGRRILEVPVKSYDVHQIAEMILDFPMKP
jgi:tRNA 2-selenouridine synthase